MADNIKMTYRTLFFGGAFWQKVLNTPCQRKKSAYRISKLKLKMDRTRKDLDGLFQAFTSDLAAKAGDGKPYRDQQIIPFADPEKQALYAEIFDQFCNQEAELDIEKLPLDTFDHLTFTPNEWENLQEVAAVTEAALEDPAPGAHTGPQLVSG